MNTPKNQMYITIPREDPVVSLLTSYFELNFEVTEKADNARYGDGSELNLGNLGPIALFCNFQLTTSSGKLVEDIRHAHIVCLMHKF